MDQFIFASLSHTHYWYEVGMLKVPADNNKTDVVLYLRLRSWVSSPTSTELALYCTSL